MKTSSIAHFSFAYLLIYTASVLGFRLAVGEYIPKLSILQAAVEIFIIVPLYYVFFFFDDGQSDPVTEIKDTVLVSSACIFVVYRVWKIQVCGRVPEAVNLKGKVVFLTGGSQGIGLETLRFFLENGATVIVGVRKKSLKSLISKFENYSNQLVLYELDLTNFESIKAFLQTLKSRTDCIDIFVSNAGILKVSPEEITLNSKPIQTNIFVNHLAASFLAVEISKIMKPSGQIISVCSSQARRLLRGKKDFKLEDIDYEQTNSMESYAVSKLLNCVFMIGLSEKLRGKINVKLVSPGSVATSISKDITKGSPVVGSYCTILAATDDTFSKTTGSYFELGEVVPDLPKLETKEEKIEVDKVWKLTEKMLGTDLSL
eukprot:snap_masked-scaffold_6-processed-gene-3.17-mRNA-1 protein AED:1.00 eAED:1.00 QI:0/0/0/0/1/1/2/0/372